MISILYNDLVRKVESALNAYGLGLDIGFDISYGYIPIQLPPNVAPFGYTLLLVTPSPIIGEDLAQVVFLPMTRPTQEQVDKAVRENLDALRGQKAQLLNGNSADPTNIGRV